MMIPLQCEQTWEDDLLELLTDDVVKDDVYCEKNIAAFVTFCSRAGHHFRMSHKKDFPTKSQLTRLGAVNPYLVIPTFPSSG